MGGGLQGIQGDDNIQIQGDNSLMLIIKELHLILEKKELPGVPNREEKQRKLLAAVTYDVVHQLEQQLLTSVPINLKKEMQPDQVTPLWTNKMGAKLREILPETTRILDVFNRKGIGGKFLILGTPGSGKTTTLLELAGFLLKSAKEDSNKPIPVIFNLSSWKSDKQSLAKWLIAELNSKSKYRVPINIGKKWLEDNKLVLMLDGLDELKPNLQQPCFTAINEFLEESPHQYLVVSCRRKEYENLVEACETPIKLNGAICLKPLTNIQILDYLTATNHGKLWQAIKGDLALLKLVRTPLLLSVTILAYQEVSVEQWQQQNTREVRIKFLLDTYVLRMLNKKIDSAVYVNKKPPNARKTRLCLIWLAQQLQREAQTEFLIEEIQSSWLATVVQRRIYHWGSSLLLVLIFWLFFGLIFGLTVGLFFGLFVGLFVGLFFRLKREIEPIETLNWSWEKAKIDLLLVPMLALILALFGNYSILVAGLIYQPIRGVISRQNPQKNNLLGKKARSNLVGLLIFILIIGLFYVLTHGLIDRLIVGLFSGLFGMLFSGLISPSTETKTIPNQGIFKSAVNAGISGLIVGLIGGLIVGLFSGLLVGLFFGLTVGLIAGLFLGGHACIQHFILRLILYNNGYIPWNYARFLDYATERLFLQRVGGRYRFIHKLLQEHFAQMPLDTFR